MQIEALYDDRTSTLTYVVWDPDTRDAVIIDPVLDYEPKASKIWDESVQRVLALVEEKELSVHYVLETHAHADHLSGSQLLKDALPEARTAIGEDIREVQALFKEVFGLPDDFPTDGRQFDELVREGETVRAGSLEIEVVKTPGHTPACVSYLIGDALFTGDALFMPDSGTGRCDFPGGSAEDMYDSIQKVYALPDDTRIFVGHDYQPGGREVRWETTVAEQKAENIQIREDTTREEYVQMRTTRDATLEAPQLLLQSVQVNIDAGNLPEAAEGGRQYLRIPINVFKPEVEKDDLELRDV